MTATSPEAAKGTGHLPREQQETTTLVIAGSIDLAELVTANIGNLKKFPDMLDTVYTSVMKKDTDYGTLPGTSKPCLLKPGAEILIRWANLVPELSITHKVEQADQEHPYFFYGCECRLYGKNGFVGSGMGSCNTRETRYGFRWVSEYQLPASADKTKLQTRPAYGKTQYRVPTPPEEIYTLANTCLKMAQKRAFVDAVLRVTGASRIFTQDVDEEENTTGKSQQSTTSPSGSVAPPTSTSPASKPATKAPTSQPAWTDNSS